MAAEVVPASISQRLLWFLGHYRGSNSISMPRLYEITEVIDLDALDEACTWLRARHETLRTTIEGRGRHLVQRIDDPGPLRAHRVVRAGATERREACQAELTADLSAEPVRISVVTDGHLANTLCINIHHLLTDAWSTRVISNELSVAYQAATNGVTAQLPPPAWQYRHFAAWQAERLQGPHLARLQENWHERLRGAEPLPLSGVSGAEPARSAIERFTLSPELLGAVDALARQHRCTRFAVMLAAFWMTMFSQFGQDDVTIGSLFANRPRREMHGTVGFFANMILLRAHVSAAGDFVDLLHQATDTLVHALANQELPCQMLAPETVAGGSRERLGDVVLNVLPTSRTGGGRFRSGLLPLGTTPESRNRFALEMALWPDLGHPRGMVRFAPDRFDVTWVSQLIETFQTLLEASITDAHEPVGALTRRLRARVETTWAAVRPKPVCDNAGCQAAAQVVSERALTPVRLS